MGFSKSRSKREVYSNTISSKREFYSNTKKQEKHQIERLTLHLKQLEKRTTAKTKKKNPKLVEGKKS